MNQPPTSSDYSAPSTSGTAGISADQENYLGLLAIGHYVLAGFAFLFGFIPVIHFVFGLSMLGGFGGLGGPEMTFGCFFALIGLFMIASAWAYGYFMVLAGNSLKARKRHTLCLVMAAISCTIAPIGTIVGILTLLLLLNNDVKAEFDRAAAAF